MGIVDSHDGDPSHGLRSKARCCLKFLSDGNVWHCDLPFYRGTLSIVCWSSLREVLLAALHDPRMRRSVKRLLCLASV